VYPKRVSSGSGEYQPNGGFIGIRNGEAHLAVRMGVSAFPRSMCEPRRGRRKRRTAVEGGRGPVA